MIKLGGECNLKCKFCHSENHQYQYNPDIIDYIKSQGVSRVTFSGGEPLMYWDTITKITQSLGNDINYRMVSNLTLLTEDKVDFLNKYNFLVCGSYDGSDGLRDCSLRPRWDVLSKINKQGFAVTVYQENLNLEKIKNELEVLVSVNRLKNCPSFFPNFVHTTKNVTDGATSLDTAKEYLRQISRLIEVELMTLRQSDEENPLRTRAMLNKALQYWWVEKDYRGVRCANENSYSIALNGKFILCPYEHEFIGDIYTGLDLEKIDRLTPQKCKVCPIFNICKGSCWANKTNQECYIARKMNKWLNIVIDKWGVKEKVLEALTTFKTLQFKQNYA